MRATSHQIDQHRDHYGVSSKGDDDEVRVDVESRRLHRGTCEFGASPVEPVTRKILDACLAVGISVVLIAAVFALKLLIWTPFFHG